MNTNTASAPSGNGNGQVSHDAQQAPRPPGHDDHEQLPTDLPQPDNKTVAIIGVVIVVLLAVMFVVGWLPHHREARQAASDAAERAAMSAVVQVSSPKPQVTSKDLRLPCDIRANQETSLYPRANGYLKTLAVGASGKPVDIGEHVEAGQLLAEIDTPEVDAQLRQSQAALEQAKAAVTRATADLNLAGTTLQRYQEAQKVSKGSVTQEDVDIRKAAYDQANSSVAQADANVKAAEADVQRLTVLQGFEKIVAPFSGTITTRNYDVGALLSPGNVGPGKELFHIAQSDPLRVFVSVPQTYVTQIHTDQPAYLTVRNFPGRTFEGVTARAAGAIDSNTRTMWFELHFPNKDGTLVPGMFGEARLGVSSDKPVLTIPTSAMIFNAKGTQVALVKDGKVHFNTITLGRDLGTELEVMSGINSDDKVVVNPNEQLAEGVEVKTSSLDDKQPKPLTASAKAN